MIRRLGLATIVGTCTGSFVSALFRAIQEPWSFRYLLSNTIWLSSFGILLALPVAFTYGAGMYLLLNRLHWVNWSTSVIAGALPGLLLLAFTSDVLNGAIVAVGICVACAFHWLMRRDAANTAFKPNGHKQPWPSAT